MTAQDGISQQVALYGEPLSARFGRLLAAFHIPQSRLAKVVGLSAPMLSQLASGQRVKISNPAVFGRLLRLEELAQTPAVRSGDPGAIASALEDVAASRPTLTTQHTQLSGPEQVLAHLAGVSTPAELRTVAPSGTALGDLLRSAADYAEAHPSR